MCSRLPDNLVVIPYMPGAVSTALSEGEGTPFAVSNRKIALSGSVTVHECPGKGCVRDVLPAWVAAAEWRSEFFSERAARAAELHRSGGANFSCCWLATAPIAGNGDTLPCGAAPRLLPQHEVSNGSSFQEAFETRCTPRSREKVGLKKRYFWISEILAYVILLNNKRKSAISGVFRHYKKHFYKFSSSESDCT